MRALFPRCSSPHCGPGPEPSHSHDRYDSECSAISAPRCHSRSISDWCSALVLANFGRHGELLIAGVPVGHELERRRQPPPIATEPPGEKREQGSVIVLLATDAPLDARKLGRLTRRVPLGLARTGTLGGHGSGDLAIAFSTAHRIPHDSTPLTHTVTALGEQHPVIDALFAAGSGNDGGSRDQRPLRCPQYRWARCSTRRCSAR
jgi:hypothetical protein